MGYFGEDAQRGLVASYNVLFVLFELHIRHPYRVYARQRVGMEGL